MNSSFIIYSLTTIIVFLVFFIAFQNKIWYKRCWRVIKFQALMPFRACKNYKRKKGDQLIDALLGWQNKQRLKIRKLSSGLRDLSPIETVDENRAYSNSLVWAVENKSVKNIALSGPYGSGKSSILKTFQKRHPEYNYLNISLASFKDKDTTLNVEKVLLSILQQIFYYVKSNSMPDSRYKKIDRLSKKNRFFKSVFLIAWALSLLLILKETSFDFIPQWTAFYTGTPKTMIRYIALFIFLGGTLLMLYYFFRLYNNSRLSKLSISSGELEIAARDKSSILNKHLDEILYFFEIAKYNVVIIEDLDRFDALKKTEIFTKLREINTLINNAQAIGRHVVFIYAVKDEIFTLDTRTKFFDLIIPVIPVITTSNSEDQMRIQLGAAGVTGLSGELLKYVAAYITDMRMLINIVNEFLIYKTTIGNFDYDPNHLLAMMLYKNLETEDYALLQKDQGVVASFFKKRIDFNPMLLQTLEKNIKELETELQLQDALFHESKKELRAVYLYELNNALPAQATGDIYLENVLVPRQQLHEDVNFPRLLTYETIVYERKPTNYSQQTSLNLTFKSIEDKVNPKLTYQQRENILLVRLENRTESKRRALEGLYRDKAEIISFRMKVVLGFLKIEVLDVDLAKKPILCYLIEKGFIDEEYHNYLSHFYGENMSNADRNYYFSVVYRKPTPFDLKLDKIGAIIEQISDSYFLEPFVLNLNLLNYIFQNINTHRDKAGAIIKQLSTNQKELTQIVQQYLNQGRQVGIFIQLLSLSWGKFWEFVDLESGYSEDIKQRYLRLILNYATPEAIIRQDTNKVLSSYIAGMAKFSEFAESILNQEKLQNTLKSLEVKFEYIHPRKADRGLFSLVRKENLYRINRKMVSIMLTAIKKEAAYDISLINSQNYTTIINAPDTNFIDNIHQGIEEYLTAVFLKIAGNKKELESSILLLLNNEQILESTRIELINFVETKIEDINSLRNQSLHIPLVTAKKITPTWANINSYFELIKEVDEHLSAFLNDEEVYKALPIQKHIQQESGEAVNLTTLNKAIILTPEITDLAFSFLIPTMEEEFEELDISGLSQSKITLLIEKGFLALNLVNYESLKRQAEGKNITLLEYHDDDEQPSWSGLEFDPDDYFYLYKSKVFTFEQKLEIFKEMAIIAIKNEKLADALAELFSTYDGRIDRDKLYYILQNSKNEDSRVRVLMKQIPQQDEDYVTELFNAMGTPYNEINEKGGYFTLQATDYNYSLAKQIEKKYVGKIGTKGALIKVNRLRK